MSDAPHMISDKEHKNCQRTRSCPTRALAPDPDALCTLTNAAMTAQLNLKETRRRAGGSGTHR